MRFVDPLVFVSDVTPSIAFYADSLGLEIVERHEDFVLFDQGFAIHHGRSLLRAAGLRDGEDVPWGRRNLVLYVRTENPRRAFDALRATCPVVHPPRLEPWGETPFRITDPDGHLVEIGDGARD